MIETGYGLFTTPCVLIFSLFFFLGSRSLRYLHSFPTRRSSDLCFRVELLAWNAIIAVRRPDRQAHGSGRSEEHTSELQSRLHLVCRLLLEKKKKLLRQCCGDAGYMRSTTLQKRRAK